MVGEQLSGPEGRLSVLGFYSFHKLPAATAAPWYATFVLTYVGHSKLPRHHTMATGCPGRLYNTLNLISGNAFPEFPPAETALTRDAVDPANFQITGKNLVFHRLCHPGQRFCALLKFP